MTRPPTIPHSRAAQYVDTAMTSGMPRSGHQKEPWPEDVRPFDDEGIRSAGWFSCNNSWRAHTRAIGSPAHRLDEHRHTMRAPRPAGTA